MSERKGFGPDHNPGAVKFGGGIVAIEGEADGGFGGKFLETGEAYAVFAEVDCPGIILLSDRFSGFRNFGKSEPSAQGDAGRAATVDECIVLGGDGTGILGDKLIIMATRGMAAGEAIGGNMLIYRKKYPLLDQLADPGAFFPIGARGALADLPDEGADRMQRR